MRFRPSVFQTRISVLLAVLLSGTMACSALRPIPPAQVGAPAASGATSGGLTVRRVELVFHNERPRITVARNAALRAWAVIEFDGNGAFRATWLVDGRVAGLVARSVTQGASLTLETDAASPLPTFEPGTHEVTLRIEQPATTLAPPVIRYTVTVDAAPVPPGTN